MAWAHEEYGAASDTVEQEANAAADIFWLADRLPEPRGTHIQELVRSYAQEVVEKEWPLMEQGRTPLMTQERGTPAGWTIIDDIRQNIQGFEPRTKADEQLYGKGSTRSIPSPTQGGCAWSRRRATRGPLGRSDLRWDSGNKLHLPIRLGEHLGAQADGGDPGGGDRTSTVHRRRLGVSLLRGCSHRHGGVRPDPGEVRNQRAQEPPKGSTSVPTRRGAWKVHSANFRFTEVSDGRLWDMSITLARSTCPYSGTMEAARAP